MDLWPACNCFANEFLVANICDQLKTKWSLNLQLVLRPHTQLQVFCNCIFDRFSGYKFETEMRQTFPFAYFISNPTFYDHALCGGIIRL